MVFGKFVFGQVETKDRYGRHVCKLMTAENKVNADRLRNGFAWRFDKYSKSKKLADLQAKAKAEKLGLWADKDPIPPWEYRDQVERERLAKKAAEAEAAKAANGVADRPPTRATSKKPPPPAMSYWITTNSGVRHNSGCRWYRKSKGAGLSQGRGQGMPFVRGLD
jgi:hypothetical protein